MCGTTSVVMHLHIYTHTICTNIGVNIQITSLTKARGSLWWVLWGWWSIMCGDAAQDCFRNLWDIRLGQRVMALLVCIRFGFTGIPFGLASVQMLGFTDVWLILGGSMPALSSLGRLTTFRWSACAFPSRTMIVDNSLGADALASTSSSNRTSSSMGGMSIGRGSAMVSSAMCNNGPALILASATLLQKTSA